MVIKFLQSSLQKLKNALSKTRSFLASKIHSLFSGKIDHETLDQLEQALYEADLGVKTATELTEKVKSLLRDKPGLPPEEIIAYLKGELLGLLESVPESKDPISSSSPEVFLIVGVNGNGKTTATAKLAKKFVQDKQKVLLGAADTFRAAAIEQLERWSQQVGVEMVKGFPKSDPAAVVFDTLSAAKARNYDKVIIDTAGRLHTKTPLMQELEKIKRTCQKVIPGSPHHVYLVIDATTGQNGIDQARTFSKFVHLTGLIMTKLDGTAKGGILIAIQRELGIPVKYIGIGEGIDDLEPFNSEAFVNSIFE